VSTPASPFRVAVRDLPASRRIDVPATFVAGAVKGMTLREALELGADGPWPEGDGGTAELELDATEDGEDHVFAHGAVKGGVTVACSRCLAPVTVRFDERVRVTFMRPEHMPAEDASDDDARAGADGDTDGVELGEGELDVFPFDGETVDLEPLVREQFVLAVPYAPLCREECRGLCPQCGVDKNQGDCRCERPIDPRFMALQGLKLPS
jgi:uncharacterized protein